ncbi:MAG: hypothetical protein GY909_07575 [Oligoflexia bacterium]|nr:hypothetical protein [Oligoflexia bacterium]
MMWILMIIITLPLKLSLVVSDTVIDNVVFYSEKEPDGKGIRRSGAGEMYDWEIYMYQGISLNALPLIPPMLVYTYATSYYRMKYVKDIELRQRYVNNYIGCFFNSFSKNNQLLSCNRVYYASLKLKRIKGKIEKILDRYISIYKRECAGAENYGSCRYFVQLVHSIDRDIRLENKGDNPYFGYRNIMESLCRDGYNTACRFIIEDEYKGNHYTIKDAIELSCRHPIDMGGCEVAIRKTILKNKDKFYQNYMLIKESLKTRSKDFKKAVFLGLIDSVKRGNSFQFFNFIDYFEFEFENFDFLKKDKEILKNGKGFNSPRLVEYDVIHHNELKKGCDSLAKKSDIVQCLMYFNTVKLKSLVMSDDVKKSMKKVLAVTKRGCSLGEWVSCYLHTKALILSQGDQRFGVIEIDKKDYCKRGFLWLCYDFKKLGHKKICKEEAKIIYTKHEQENMCKYFKKKHNIKENNI